MIKENVVLTFILILGLITLIGGEKKPMPTIMMNLLVTSIVVWLIKGPVEMMLFVSIVLPIVFVAKKSLVFTKAKEHSTIHEKVVTCLAFLPSFGIYFLNREKIEASFLGLVIGPEVLVMLEIILIIITALSIYAFQRGRNRL
jgi:hypothetical protein